MPMISASQLSEEQIGQVREWAEGGDQLPEIQKKLVEVLGLSATYMDTRFLVLDLGIELKSEEPEPEPEPEEEKVAEENVAEGAEAPTPAEGAGGEISVTLDSMTRPGAAVSGQITFSDGEKGMWMIDQEGRPGLDTQTQGYRPSEADLVAFEQELRRLLQGEE
ncbi:MAG: hypothetical protein OSA48_03325 [Akkermansiaceae bacterium]|nr:hypothetical protein [Akkermansiaceae bacterium]